MATLDQAVEFTRRWITAEHDAIVAQWREHDDGAFAATVAELGRGYYVQGLPVGIQRAPGKDDAYYRMADGILEATQPRILFHVDRYDHPTRGEMYAAYVSSTNRPSRELYSRYFITADGGLRLLTREDVCDECEGTGKRAGRACNECNGSGWIRRGGPDVGDPGPVKETKTFESPAPPPKA